MASSPGDPSTTTRAIARGHELRLAAVDATFVDGPDRGLRFRLGSRPVRVGTGAGAELRLTDPTVSRLHCVLEVRDRGIRVIDLESTNGVLVHGVRVFDAEVGAGAIVQLGSSVLRLDVGGESVGVELSPIDRFGSVIGSSAEMRRLYAVLDRIAPTDTTVLIQGETGSGKEAIAGAIHEASRRAEGPFVPVDCGAIAETLIESELFGHVRGAFSGAVSDRRGLIEDADEGTLFLDEVGELPLSLQPKLLRVLETREVRRLGSNTTRRVDIRVLAATHRPLAHAVNVGTFREDLYYRLAVVEVQLPPLRARREDIGLLAEHFYKKMSGSDQPLPPEVVATLRTRDWPGNVRELRNFVERSISLGWAERSNIQNSAAAPSETPSGPRSAPPPVLEGLIDPELPLKEARARWTEQFELLYASTLLRRTNGNVTRAAEKAGVARRSFQRLMVERGIRSADGQWSVPPPGPGGDAEDEPPDDD
jgi:transcriptional regulator with GAF, ATPase, and Fis domain